MPIINGQFISRKAEEAIRRGGPRTGSPAEIALWEAITGDQSGRFGALGGSVKDPRDPILQAADIQQQSLEDAIPFFQPFMDAGLMGLEQFQQTSTPEGLDSILARIMGGDAFSLLEEERIRGAEGMLGAGGLTRSGEALQQGADIGGNLALQLEGILSGRSGGLADTGFQGASSIADLTTRIGEAIASGILGVESRDNTRKANRDTNRSNLLGAGIGGLFSAAGSAGGFGSLFSDPALKENITKLSDIGPLGLYEWDWIEEVPELVQNMPTKGFLSTEVKDHFPEFVNEFGGFDIIDYEGLIKRLRCHS